MAGEATTVINTIALIIFFGVFMGRLAERLKMPKMVFLILLGAAYSFFESPLLVNFQDNQVKDLAFTIAEIALLMVLFQEGMHIDLRKLGSNILPVLILAVLGTIVTATLVGTLLSLRIFFNEGLASTEIFIVSLLIAAIIVPTDPAATLSILKSGGSRINKKIEVIMSGESAFNDVIAILLVSIVLLPKVEQGDFTLTFSSEVLNILFQQFFGGLAIGYLTGLVILLLIRRFNREADYAYITFSGALAIFILAPILNISMALAALIAGIIVENPRFVLMSEVYHKETMYAFWDNIVYLIEILAFVFVGLLIDIQNFGSLFISGLSLGFIVLFSRIVSVYSSTGPLELIPKLRYILTNKERLFISFAGFKGLTTAVLALLVYVKISPVNESLANLILFASLGVILVSGIIQGLALPYITRKTGVAED